MTTQTKTTELNHAKEQALAQLASIIALVKAFNAAVADGNNTDAQEEAERSIHDDPLSVLVRDGWRVPGDYNGAMKDQPVEFEILLCTGGPAVRIVGELSEHNEPMNPRLEYQDWGAPWTQLNTTGAEQALQSYCERFWFGE